MNRKIPGKWVFISIHRDSDNKLVYVTDIKVEKRVNRPGAVISFSTNRDDAIPIPEESAADLAIKVGQRFIEMLEKDGETIEDYEDWIVKHVKFFRLNLYLKN